MPAMPPQWKALDLEETGLLQEDLWAALQESYECPAVELLENALCRIAAFCEVEVVSFSSSLPADLRPLTANPAAKRRSASRAMPEVW